MKLEQVACQLYTVREHLRKPRDIAASLAKVRAIGYGAVQLSGLGEIKAPELARMLKDEGLVCAATHEPGDEILDRPQAVAERLRLLNCRVVAYPWPGGVSFDTLPQVRAFAARLDAAGAILREAGIALCYHNHHLEFRRIGGGPVLEILFAETNPLHVAAELDTYWVQFGGGDPVDWCRRMKGRLVNLHMKDYAISAKNEVVFAEVGSGNLNWPAIVRAADESGCRWFSVEQDTCPGDPFESLRKSYEFVKQYLCG